MILQLLWHLSIRVLFFANTFLWVISRTSTKSLMILQYSLTESDVMHRICQYYIQTRKIKGLNEMFLQFLDNVAQISWEKTR